MPTYPIFSQKETDGVRIAINPESVLRIREIEAGRGVKVYLHNDEIFINMTLEAVVARLTGQSK